MNRSELLDRLTTLQRELADLWPTLGLAADQSALADAQTQMQIAGFWDDPKTAQTVSQTAARLEKKLTLWQDLKADTDGLLELLKISTEAETSELLPEISSLTERWAEAKTQALLSGEYDAGNALVSIFVGNGGQDAEDFSLTLLRMYLRHAEQQSWRTQIIDRSDTDDGLRSATVSIQGDYAYGRLRSEHGVHRLIRISPFNAKGLRQTSFARVEVMPEIDDNVDLNLDPSDIRVDVFRSSGPGGQSVNTTDSAVRLTYLPLNLTVSCQNEKSQQQNKLAAMKVLKSRLLQLQLEQRAQELSEIRGEVMAAAFGSQIRTYTLQPYKLVKDHRTDTEFTNPDKVFDGHLEPFITAYLQHEAQAE